MATTAATLYEPFDAGAGANVTEAGWRKMARHWLESGVLRNEDNELVISPGSGLAVQVGTGKFWVRGHYGEQSAAQALALAPVASGTYAIAPGSSRLDRVVLRADFDNNVIGYDVLPGTPATTGTQVAAAVTQSSSVWEIPLATILLTNGDSTVDVGDIGDLRVWAVPRHGAGGLLDESAVSADQGSITTEVDLTGMTVDAVLQPDHWYRLVVYGHAQSTVAADQMFLKLLEGATVLNFAQVTTPATASRSVPMRTSHEFTVGAVGRHTYKATMVRTGTGTVTFKAAATQPARIVIEDIGPVVG